MSNSNCESLCRGPFGVHTQLKIGEVIEWHPATTSNLQQGVHLTFHSHTQILSSV